MPDLTFSLSRYDGPATINSVEFPKTRLVEHADLDNGAIRKQWEGEAEVLRSEAPRVSPQWADIEGPVEIRLPGGEVVWAHIVGMTLTDNNDLGIEVWRLELVGVGPLREAGVPAP